MEPTHNNLSAPELQPVPPNQPERPSKLGGDERAPQPMSQEQLPGGMETPQSGQPVVSLPSPIDPHQLLDDRSGAGQVATAPSQQANPVIADDVDLIEKEWVDKAKAIVSEYKHDPYMQEKEVGKLQADYLKKRYGKTIKSGE